MIGMMNENEIVVMNVEEEDTLIREGGGMMPWNGENVEKNGRLRDDVAPNNMLKGSL
jgi:hypothetical protein